jgi:GNAT superfamily N-acetyltransferase
MTMPLSIRAAKPDDVPALDALIAASARILSRGFYDEAQSEAAIKHVFGVDSVLVGDGSYFIAESDANLAGCGGWSKRATLFGGDRYAVRQSGLLNPVTQPAKIRAFFVHPSFARCGVGTALLKTSEVAAMVAGFSSAELMATLPGAPFYAAHGYVPTGEHELELDGVLVRFIPMEKSLH